MKFDRQEEPLLYLHELRWGDDPRCPRCQTPSPYLLAKLGRFRCRKCRYGFTVTTGTHLHALKSPIEVYIKAASAYSSGITCPTAMERCLGVAYKSAYLLVMKFHEAHSNGANSPEELLRFLITTPQSAGFKEIVKTQIWCR